jgi:hypothetical protein
MAYKSVGLAPLRSGIRNYVPDNRTSRLKWLDAVNVDFADVEFIRTAKSLVSRVQSTFHSLFQSRQGLFAVDESNHLILINFTTLEVLDLGDVGSSARVSYYEDVNGVWFTSLTDNGLVVNSQRKSIGIKAPDLISVSHMAGNITGQIIISAVLIDPDGVRSGGSESYTVTLKENSIHVKFSAPLFGWKVGLYISRPNSSILHLVDSNNTGEFDVFDLENSGNTELAHAWMPLPNGHLITGMGGRTYVAKGDILYFTDPYHRGMYKPATNEIRFAGRIKLLQSVQNSLYVGDEAGVHYLGNSDPSEFTFRTVYTGKVIGDASITTSANKMRVDTSGEVALFFTEDGIALGRPDGTVVLPHKGNYVPEFSQVLSIDIGDNHGIDQIICTTV